MHWNIAHQIRKAIKVELQYVHQQLVISVWNNGAHLTDETLQHADSLFYRNDKNRNLNDAHFGIGLAFVKKSVRITSWNIRN